MTDPRITAAQARSELRQTGAAFQAMRDAAAANWAASKPNEVEKREECYRLIHVIDQVQAQLLGVVQTGEIEEFVAEQHGGAESEQP